AVNQVNLSVAEGSIHALVGPNGAGKSTLFNLITKFLSPYSGQIHYKGQEITDAGPDAISREGMVHSFQISSIFPDMSALENVRIALQARSGKSHSFWRSDKQLQQFNERALELLEMVGLANQRSI